MRNLELLLTLFSVGSFLIGLVVGAVCARRHRDRADREAHNDALALRRSRRHQKILDRQTQHPHRIP